MGQDLAFTGGKSHTSGIEGALGDNDKYIKSRCLMEVEGIDGTMLQTDFQMWYYKQWFEKAIRDGGDRMRVIDATEGGARIEGHGEYENVGGCGGRVPGRVRLPED